MAVPNEFNWNDPRTIAAIGGLVVGIIGFTYGIFKDRWSRRESRLEVLAKILEPMVRCSQSLLVANNTRRTIEQLKHSFPGPLKPAEVIQRIDHFHDEYSEHIKKCSDDFRNGEAAFASHGFRLPDSITKLIKELQKTLSEFGHVVNEGMFDKADIQLAKFRDDYTRIRDTARGWRLADPLEGILRHFRKSEAEKEKQRSEFELTQEEMNGVLELLYKRATTQANNTFVVHPPKKICDNPEILQSDNVIDELRDSIFSVVFQDGTAKMLSLPELMALSYNLLALKQQWDELNTMIAAAKPAGDRNYQVNFEFSMKDVMKPEMVKLLLSTINFSDEPSDG